MKYYSARDYYKYMKGFKGNTYKTKYYIAYGSNLNKAQMKDRCPTAKAVYTGLMTGWELFYAGSKSGNYATIRRCEGKSVPVAVWEITPYDEFDLDMYEGYPTFYYKDTIKFWVDGVQKEAMVYIMRKDATEGKPSRYYVNTVRQGYRDFKLDEKYLDESLTKWKKEEKPNNNDEVLLEKIWDSEEELIRKVEDLGYWIYAYKEDYIFCGNNDEELFIHLYSEEGGCFITKISRMEVE